jgi:hypothetical protein
MTLNMFRTSLCSSSGEQLYIYSIWYRPTLYASPFVIGALDGSLESGTISDTGNIQLFSRR